MSQLFRAAAVVLAIAVVAFGAGYLYRDSRHVDARIVTADSCSAMYDGSGTCMVDGIGYGIPVHVEWTDSMGALNDGSDPACLPPLTSATGLRVAVAWVWVGDVGTAYVFWIDCRDEPTRSPGVVFGAGR